MVLQGRKSSPQKSRPLESGHRRHGVWIAIEYSYKLGQKNEFKFLCVHGRFLQRQSHIELTYCCLSSFLFSYFYLPLHIPLVVEAECLFHPKIHAIELYCIYIAGFNTVHGKILEGEIFGELLLMKQLRLARKILANLLAIYKLFHCIYIRIGEENLANCIPFTKFAKIFPLQIFPHMVTNTSV